MFRNASFPTPPRDLRQRGSALRLALALLLALPLFAIGGCDNPACVFGGDCFNGGGSGGGGLGTNPASTPPDDAWLLPGAPQITGSFPTGATISTTTPLVLTFSESMAGGSLIGAFELVATSGFGQPVPLLPPALLGDGRLMVLLPAFPLMPSTTYELSLAENATVFDLLGTSLITPTSGLLHTITVADTDPTNPSVVTTWPPTGASGQSTTGEIAVVFDRGVQGGTVNVDSLAVTVGGVTPPQNPAPTAAIFAGGGLPTTDTRAWRWRSVDNQGDSVSLGEGANVNMAISPAGNSILDIDGNALAASDLNYDLLEFGAPASAELVSLPLDAIGIANLDGTTPLEVAVQIDGGLTSDRLGIFLFGPNTAGNAQIALFREVELADVGYDPLVGVATLTEAQLDLAASGSPVTGNLGDGRLSVAMRIERSGSISPVRLLDTDRNDPGVQSPLLDTTRPELRALGSSGSSLSLLRSDLRDLVVVGRASEELRAIEVSAAASSNGALAPALSFGDPDTDPMEDPLFVAAPVALGLIDPAQLPLSFDVRLYDRALNASSQLATANFEQLAGSGPGVALPGNATVAVRVFDVTTRQPVSGARVITHQANGGAPVLVDAATTSSDGRVTVLAAPAGDTLVSVDAGGYGLFTFDTVPTSRLDVPLFATGGQSATFSGVLSTTDTGVPALDKWAADARLLALFGTQVAVQSCSFNPLTLGFDCIFAPAPMRAGDIGATGVVGVNPPPGEFGYSAAGFLKGWTGQLPLEPVSAGAPSGLQLALDETLDAAGADIEAAAIDGPAFDLNAQSATGLDLDNLVSDPTVAVESRLRGQSGFLLSGYGVSFPTSGTPTDLWRVRCAIPGALDFDDTTYPGDELGELVADGIVDSDPFVRVALRDTAGNRSARRARFSQVSGPLTIAAVPSVVSPAAGTGTGGAAFDVVVTNVTGGGINLPTLRHVILTAANGRQWHVWGGNGGGLTSTLRVPDIAAGGGQPLGNGAIVIESEVFAWAGFDVAAFAWSDLERLSDVSARSAPIGVSQP